MSAVILNEARKPVGTGGFSLRLGHATHQAPHRGVIHYRVATSLRRALQVKLRANTFATAKQLFVPILGNRTKMVAGVPVEQRKAVPMHFAKLWNEAETLPIPLTQTFCLKGLRGCGGTFLKSPPTEKLPPQKNSPRRKTPPRKNLVASPRVPNHIFQMWHRWHGMAHVARRILV